MVPRHSIVRGSCSGRRLHPCPHNSFTSTLLKLLLQPSGITVFSRSCRQFMCFRESMCGCIYSFPFSCILNRLFFHVFPSGSGHFFQLRNPTGYIHVSRMDADLGWYRHSFQGFCQCGQNSLMIGSVNVSESLSGLFLTVDYC